MLTVDGLIAGYQHGSRVLGRCFVSYSARRDRSADGTKWYGKINLAACNHGASAGVRKDRAQWRGDYGAAISRDRQSRRRLRAPRPRDLLRIHDRREPAHGGDRKKGLPNRVPDWAYETFPMLRERRLQRAGTMSGGQQQQLAIMRALVGEPELLLLDEPSEGIQPSIVQEIARTLRRTAQEKQLTVLLVEQNLELVVGMASRSLFMENGRVVDEAPVEKIRLGSELVERYLSV